MFTKSQRDLLKSVGRKSNHPDFGKPNPQLDDVILQLQRENPQAFLKDSDLADRIFMDQPADGKTVYAGFLYAVGER
jgi:hypothetical protein